jgi:hypothetical protein
MKRTLLLLAALSLPLFAQDDAAFAGWMKSVGGGGRGLRAALEAKNGEEAATDAKKLQAVFVEVKGYWDKKGVADAAKMSATAADAYGEVAAMASAGKFEEASDSLKKASATCGGCHSMHREKAADGSWKIK